MVKFSIVFIVFLFVTMVGCKKDKLTYQITSSVSNGGTIDPLGVTNVEAGGSILLTIKPDANYTISSIKVDGVDILVAKTVEIKNIRSNKVIKVEFALNTFTIAASADAGVVLNPSGTFTVNYGDSMIFSFNAKPNRSIKSIRVNKNPVSPYPNKSYVVDGNRIILRANENNSLRIESILNDSLFVTSGRWYLNILLQKNLDFEIKTWMTIFQEPKMYTDYKTFTMDGFCTENDKNGNVFGGPYRWSVQEGFLTFKGWKYPLPTLNKDTLTMDYVSGAITNRYVYTHRMKQ